MINFEERRRYGVYFRVERTDDPDYTYQGLPEELPTSFLCVGVDSSLAEEVERWCDANLYGKWKRNVFGGETMPVYGRWTFWNKRDALTFKMVWGNYKREWEDPFAIKRR
jgi:hypothetical protein